MKRRSLPNKPSKLIEVAIKDLAKVEAAKDKFVVDMADWYTPRRSNTNARTGKPACAVCFAGSVIAMSLGKGDNGDHGFRGITNERTKCKLDALNEFRSGDILNGLSEMGLKLTKGLPPFINVPDYDAKNPMPFHFAMRGLAHLLAEHGL